jgi:hypothetical protein
MNQQCTLATGGEDVSRLWPFGVAAGVAGILIAVRALENRLFTGAATASRTFWCPFRQRNVTAVFSESVWDGRFDVQACDAFNPSEAVGCERGCLNLKTLPDSKVQAPEPPPRSWVW